MANKPLPNKASFWSLFHARNLYFTGMYLRIYDGYVGQALSEMRQRLYTLDEVNGPSNGRVRLKGGDPLRLSGRRKTEWPRASRLDLFADIDATTTTIQISGTLADLTDSFGNTTERYLRIGDEIITYTSQSSLGSGVFQLTGVTRGVRDTIATAHASEDAVQRCGVYEKIKAWRAVHDLLTNHTLFPSSFITLSDWDDEGNTYIRTTVLSHLRSEPTPVEDLIGEIAQQALLYIWWSEYTQKAEMLTIRPPDDAVQTINETSHIMDGAQLTHDPDIRLTRVRVYYDIIDPLESRTDPDNFRRSYIAIDADTEAGTDGDTRIKVIYAAWLPRRADAASLAIKQLIRYKETPRFLKVKVDAKDRTLTVGTPLDVESDYLVDSEGNLKTERWQVISAAEIEAGHTYMLDMQTYVFRGRFARYMASGSPSYGSATDAQKATGGFFSNSSGQMPGGDEGYGYQ